MAVVATGWRAWPTAATSEAPYWYVIACVAALCGGLALRRGIAILVNPPTALVIDSHGIMVGYGTTPDRILWSDLRGAHGATFELAGSRTKPTFFIALELVDPRAFYARLHADRSRPSGLSAALRHDHYPLPVSDLEADASDILLKIQEGIRRLGQFRSDTAPRTVYNDTVHRSTYRRELEIAAALLITLCAAPVIFLWTPFWVEAAENCEVRNPYSGRQWRRAKPTATWSGPCIDGRAQGSGVLEWFSDGRLSVRYAGQMEKGRVTGRGEWAENGIRYDGTWNDGELREGVATYPDGRRYSGRWDKGRWIRGVLTAPGGYRLEERWYQGQLTGQGIARGPQGQYEGNWTDGVPEGSGVFVTQDGRRFDGKWRHGKPVDPEVARLQAQEEWDCLWDAASRRFGDRFAYVGTARCRNP